jgi:hypothetical protein
MIMPATTHATRARDIEPKHPTVEGPVVVRTAVMDKGDGMSATGAASRCLAALGSVLVAFAYSFDGPATL